MSTPATHSPPTPGALFELALCILDGGSAQEAALASGIDPALAQRLVRHWAFVLLLKILPMVIGDRHRSRSGQTRSARERSRIGKAVQPILSLFTKEQGEGIFSVRRELREIRRRQAKARAEAKAMADPGEQTQAESVGATAMQTPAQATLSARGCEHPAARMEAGPEAETSAPAGSCLHAHALSGTLVDKDSVESSFPDIAETYPVRNLPVPSDGENGIIAHFHEAERLISAAGSLRSAREAVFSLFLEKRIVGNGVNGDLFVDF
ncbi:MAG: hypothetical protein R3C97_07545 [Geminicoccaceae bacterium]